jgi:hypothetical protein
MERMGLLMFGDRMRRRDERLADDLTAEHASATVGITSPAMKVGLDLLDTEQRHQSRDCLFLIRH